MRYVVAYTLGELFISYLVLFYVLIPFFLSIRFKVRSSSRGLLALMTVCCIGYWLEFDPVDGWLIALTNSLPFALLLASSESYNVCEFGIVWC